MTDRKDAKDERAESDGDFTGDSTTSTGPDDIAAQVDSTTSEADKNERERRERGFGVGNRSQ